MAISYQTRLRGAGSKQHPRFTATVRRDGVSVSATFPRKDFAVSWAVKVQDEIVSARERGFVFDREKAVRRGREKTLKEVFNDADRLALARNPDADPVPRMEWTLRRAFEHYVATVTPTKKGAEQEVSRANVWKRHLIAGKQLADITPSDVQTHVNARLAAGKAAMTIRNETFLLSALFRHAAKLPPPAPNVIPASGWGLTKLMNPVGTVELPEPPAHRDRRLEDAQGGPGEEQRMKEALAAGPDGELMVDLFVLALETGMRLSELLSVRPSQIRSVGGYRYIAQPDSKNGARRQVVLSTAAQAVVEKLTPNARAKGSPLANLGVTAVEYRWSKARSAAKVTGLTFHDLRHEGLSRMADRNLTIGELKAQSGHKTAEVLLRYLDARASDIARKLG